MRLHIDTDFAGDTDDACAVAMVLGWPDVEIVGITTVADPDGQRAGYVAHLLKIAGRGDIAVAVGAGRSLSTGQPMGDMPDHDAYWGTPVEPLQRRAGAALDLFERSIELGATVVAIGPFTNLALLEHARPGHLARVPLVVMGGWIAPPPLGLPSWGADMDWNVQSDIIAARAVMAHPHLTLVTLPATMKAQLREEHLPRLIASGPIGELLARQAKAHESEYRMSELGCAHRGLPDDLLNFQYDAVACAIALGWSGATFEEMSLRPTVENDSLYFEVDSAGQRMHVVVDIDADAFTEIWMSAVEAIQAQRATAPDP